MNWPEILTAATGLLSGLITLWFNLRGKAKQAELSAKLAIIQAETTAAKERAGLAALQVAKSRKERSDQMNTVLEKLDNNTEITQAARKESGEALAAANNSNAKMEHNSTAIRELRQDFQSTQPPTAV